MSMHPIERIHSNSIELITCGTSVETAIRHAVIQGWSAGWDAGTKNRLQQKAAAERYTEEVRLQIEASVKRFADLAERILATGADQ